MAKKALFLEASPEDEELIIRIAKRAADLSGGRLRPIDAMLDLSAVHLNGRPLRLRELAEADDFNLLHDVCGINRHLNRETGELGGCFVPRFSAPREAALSQVEG